MSVLIDGEEIRGDLRDFSLLKNFQSDLLFVPFLCPCPWLEETEEQLGKACVRPHCRAGEVEAVGGGEEEDEEVQGHLGLTAFIHLAFWCSCGDCQVDSNVNSSSKRWNRKLPSFQLFKNFFAFFNQTITKFLWTSLLKLNIVCYQIWTLSQK